MSNSRSPILVDKHSRKFYTHAACEIFTLNTCWGFAVRKGW